MSKIIDLAFLFYLKVYIYDKFTVSKNIFYRILLKVIDIHILISD